eukprot:3330029-Rhodomonas_salina.1
MPCPVLKCSHVTPLLARDSATKANSSERRQERANRCSPLPAYAHAMRCPVLTTQPVPEPPTRSLGSTGY